MARPLDSVVAVTVPEALEDTFISSSETKFNVEVIQDSLDEQVTLQ